MNADNKPLEFSVCPHCGGEGIAKSIADEEKARGAMGQDANAALQVLQAVIADPRKPILSVPLVVAMVDICSKCGALYAVRVEKKMVTLPPLAPPQKPRRDAPFGFGMS